MDSHKALDDTVELRSLVAITELFAIFLRTTGKSPEVLYSLWDSLATKKSLSVAQQSHFTILLRHRDP